jgi:hypothetical protein
MPPASRNETICAGGWLMLAGPTKPSVLAVDITRPPAGGSLMSPASSDASMLAVAVPAPSAPHFASG